MTGVIYARYSSDNQREESTLGQIRENTAFAEKNGIVIVGRYIDRAVSAKINNRLFFNKRVRISRHLLRQQKTPPSRWCFLLVMRTAHEPTQTQAFEYGFETLLRPLLRRACKAEQIPVHLK